ncbi:MAG TPA: hypothetical protein VJ729_16540 [Nitrososphaeraceae archaeon]|nr:hypothetical protein [Nitrososphaeraceae archaeon]
MCSNITIIEARDTRSNWRTSPQEQKSSIPIRIKDTHKPKKIIGVITTRSKKCTIYKEEVPNIGTSRNGAKTT